MDNKQSSPCTCTRDGYSPECPSIFFQDGKMLHVLNGESRLKPREYKMPNIETATEYDGCTTIDHLSSLDDGDTFTCDIQRELKVVPRTFRQNQNKLYYNTNMAPEPLAVRGHLQNNMVRGQLSDVDSMMEKNRATLRRFEALTVDGQTITSLSIGGYAVDLSKAAEKASEVTPLPPARLPVIFKDEEMNFHHHFFQGLEILFGRENLHVFLSKKKYYDDCYTRIISHVEHLINIGYRPNDTEITMFTKRVLMSTFSIPKQQSGNDDYRYLVVDANLWGFQYIESGMQMRDADLQMWLSVCYGHFRTIWFNTFKSSGVPAFALDGVQTRYRDNRSIKNPVHKKQREVKTKRIPIDESPAEASTDKRSQARKKSQPLLGWY
jgi:hypothetical protein